MGTDASAVTGIVGRDHELEAIRYFLDQQEHGGRVLLLEGDAGIGKTTLWRAGVELARERGYRVLAASASRAETQLSFTTIRDMVDDAFDEFAAELPSPQRRALAVTLLREEPSGPPSEAGAIAIALLTALRALASRGPTLLAVDDVEWLDSASAVPLQHVLHRLGSQGPRVLLSRRVEDSDELPLGLARLDERRLQVLRVGVLSPGALGRILRSRFGTTHPRPTVHRLHEVSGGNPFFALELARALGRRGETRLVRGKLPLPSSLGEVVRERLGALPEATRDALVVVSAASRPTAELVQSVAGHEAWSALVPAFEANVIEQAGDRLEFTHPLLAAAVYGDADPKRRREAHAALARPLDDPEERARHLALAVDAPDETIASELEEAARRTRRRGARVVCAELFEAAARLTPDGDAAGRARRLLAAAAALYEAGDGDRALQLLEPLVADLAEGRERVEARWRLGSVLSEIGREEDALRLWRDALEVAEDPATIADVRGSMAILSLYMETAADAIEHADRAVAAAEAAGDLERLAYALSARALATVAAGDSAYRTFVGRALELEAELEAPWSAWSPSAAAAECARLALDLEEAQLRFRAVLDQALEVGNVDVEQWAAYGLAAVNLLQGDWNAAAARSETVLDLADTTGVMRLPALRLRAEIDAYAGHVEEARSSLERVIAEAAERGQGRYVWQARVALASLALAEGEAGVAADEYRAAREVAERCRIRHPAALCALADEVEAAALVARFGQAEDALAAASSFDDPPEWAQAMLLRAKAIVLATRGELEPAQTALERSLALHSPSFLPVERGRTLLDLGVVQRRARKSTEARVTLEAARATFDSLGASLWLELARAELERVGGRGAGADELTPAEQRIAGLVAAGKTNREVAAALFITVHTVEGALKRVYRKLDVRSRTELAARLSGPR